MERRFAQKDSVPNVETLWNWWKSQVAVSSTGTFDGMHFYVGFNCSGLSALHDQWGCLPADSKTVSASV
eukprot:6114220-Amphidinium_carterae.1